MTHDLPRLEMLAARAQSGDRHAEGAFVRDLWQVALLEARDRDVPRVPIEDRHSIALHAAAIAARTYRPGRGANPLTYAKRLMRNALADEARRQRTVGRTADRTAVSLDAPLESGEGCLGDGQRDPAPAADESVSAALGEAASEAERGGQAETVAGALAGWRPTPEMLAAAEAVAPSLALQPGGRALAKRALAQIREVRLGARSMFGPEEVPLPAEARAAAELAVAVADDVERYLGEGCSPAKVRALLGLTASGYAAVAGLVAARLSARLAYVADDACLPRVVAD